MVKKIASEARRAWIRASGVCQERSGEKKIVSMAYFAHPNVFAPKTAEITTHSEWGLILP